MPNVSKVLFGDDTLIDITDTTASPEDVTEGEVFYTANGTRAVGTSRLPIASETVLGGIKVGRNLSIHENGILDATNTEYSEGDGINIEETTISLDIDYLTASRLGFIPTSEKGTNNGVATLGDDGKVPNSQLPPTPSLEWGNITGELSDQTDLQSALDNKQNVLTEGNGIDIDNNTIALDLDYLTASRLGVISSNEKGANDGVATLDENGKITNSQLPIASETSLGGIKVGQNLSIDENGVLSAVGGGGGSGNTTTIELTLAEYNALPSSEKHDTSKLYFITDADPITGIVIDDTRTSVNNLWTSLKTAQEIEEKVSPIELTLEEYNALTDEEKNDATKMYYITDVTNPTPELLFEQSTVETSFPLQHEHGINRLIKYNSLNIVVIDLILDSVTASAWSTIIGTIPEGYRPQSRIRICSTYGAAAIPYDITPNGKIVSSSNLSNTEVWLHGFWYIG